MPVERRTLGRIAHQWVNDRACEALHRRADLERLCLPGRPGALDSGEPFRQKHLGGNAMLSFDSYRDVLSEHARGHHFVKSAWFVAIAVALLIVTFG